MSTPIRPPLAPLALATVAGLLTVPLVYAALRAWDVVSGPEVNPATAPVSIHVAMFWRLSTAAFAAGLVAPVAYLAARRALRRTLEVLSVLTVAVAALTIVQGTLLP
jgi:hypothetical protein